MRAVTSRFRTPGSTTARALGKSTSRIRFMRTRLMTIPFSTGVAPPLKPVPEPRARKDAEINQAIALIGAKFFSGGNQAAIVNDYAQFRKNPNIHGIQSTG